MDTTSTHILVEYWDCDPAVLDDRGRIQAILERAAGTAGATVVQSTFHTFSPQGVTGVVVVEESHLSIHTWPETGYAAVDFFTCGDCDPEAAHPVLLDGLRAGRAELMRVARGHQPESGSIRIADHRIEVGGSSLAATHAPDPAARDRA